MDEIQLKILHDRIEHLAKDVQKYHRMVESGYGDWINPARACAIIAEFNDLLSMTRPKK